MSWAIVFFIQDQKQLRGQLARVLGLRHQWNSAKAGIIPKDVCAYVQMQRHTHHLCNCDAGKLQSLTLRLYHV